MDHSQRDQPFPFSLKIAQCPRRVFYLLIATLLILVAPSSAATRFVIDGYLATSTIDEVDFSLSQGPQDTPNHDLADPDSKVDGPIPRRVRIITEFDPSDPKSTTPIVGISNSPGLFPGMKANPTIPALWAGSDNGLYPSLDEPITYDNYTFEGTGSNNGPDTDKDGIPDSRDTDDDNDNVPDLEDAFPLDASESVDTDGDKIGNNSDTDDDGDGTPDKNDAFPLDASESLDTDGDEIGNSADLDDDGDQIPDTYEKDFGLNPLKDDAQADYDLDGYTNYEEYRAGTSPKDPDSRFVFTIKPIEKKSQNLTFAWIGVKGKTYDFEASKNGKKFVAVETKLSVEATGKVITIQINKSKISEYSFFRVRVY